jgi:hypothetical protein
VAAEADGRVSLILAENNEEAMLISFADRQIAVTAKVPLKLRPLRCVDEVVPHKLQRLLRNRSEA